MTTIHDYKLDVNQNLLLSPDGSRSVRPKTLELLLYFNQHAEKVLTKQHLLDNIWKSVGAQEHLLFQSVNEIRALLAPVPVIKTHPKIGYQWIAEQIITLESTVPERRKPRMPLVAVVSAFSLVLVFTFFLGNMMSPQPVKNVTSNLPQTLSREIVVLPFEVQIQGNSEDWVRLGAMDMLINKLRDLRQFAVPDAEEVMMALSRSRALELTELEQQANAIRTQIGEAVTLHAKLLGATMEFQLHYSLIGRYHVKQGVILGSTVQELLTKLTDELLAYYQIERPEIKTSIASQSADYALLQAMEHFHSGELEKSEAFFVTYLHTHPNNLTALRYVIKIKTAQRAFLEAENIGKRALVLARQNRAEQEQVRLLFELGVLAIMRENFELAQDRLQESRELAEQFNDTLYAAFAHTQLAHIMVMESHFEEAESFYKRALTYHQGFQCAYGQINNLQALSMLYVYQEDLTTSEILFSDAISIARANQLESEFVQLLLGKIHRKIFNVDNDFWLNNVQQLTSPLEDIPFKTQINTQIKRLRDATKTPQDQ